MIEYNVQVFTGTIFVIFDSIFDDARVEQLTSIERGEYYVDDHCVATTMRGKRKKEKNMMDQSLVVLHNKGFQI